MKYKVGDKVILKSNLVDGESYGGVTYVDSIPSVCEISSCNKDDSYYQVVNNWLITDEMIEGLAEPTDREKFEEWMKLLCNLDGFSVVWNAFNRCVTSNPDDSNYENDLEVVSDFLFGENKKKMTKSEIEAELGYKIEIIGE